ncbi:hypothetical protein JDV02_001532 [Purpureocillium takamizusanense]|uniref:SGNH hydrolase-type esterase domain-containing protein n=1 Tax=Purpureocillium takamizusanense TaxID=2060973 RepID=A0A9Q8Q9L8_9HYPO|nr:uncharacterized protein JDV02_001532 [Purpureocillium takamizusanense]UNI14956.1 hypothetical protein JDV02_001532 [Purpureocillium takamizusanense]
MSPPTSPFCGASSGNVRDARLPPYLYPVSLSTRPSSETDKDTGIQAMPRNSTGSSCWPGQSERPAAGLYYTYLQATAHCITTLLMRGVSDLAYYPDAQRILNSLKKCWAVPLSRGFKVLALTVPECSAQVPQINAARRELNAGILTHAEPNFYTMDLHEKLPYHSLSPEERSEYWSDGLHLTAEGYDWMGGHIVEGLLKILPEAAVPRTPSGPRKTRHSDGRTLVEELGDPKKLNEGYVVVRKKDLD